jgi:hypothetical protein
MLSELLLPYLAEEAGAGMDQNERVSDQSAGNSRDMVLTRKERRQQIKLARRREEIYASLTRDTDLSISSIIAREPTRILCLLNASSGGVASVTHEELEGTLRPLKGFSAVRMTLGKVFIEYI